MKELAKKLTDTYFHYDPFNGADYEEVLDATEVALASRDGCLDIINELMEMLNEALK